MSRNQRTKNTLPTGEKEDVNFLKNRVKDLETEVTTLKSRLGELRKAKNNTILKREREVIHVGEPTLGRPVGVETSKYRELEKRFLEIELQLAASEREATGAKTALQNANSEKQILEKDRDDWKHKYEMLKEDADKTKKKLETELERTVSELREKGALLHDVEVELEKLREKLELKSMQEENKNWENTDREDHITKLTNNNAYLREKIETLYMELSIKEAEWTEKEEQFKRDLTKQWGEKYGAWMAATEKRLEELHAANQMLKNCLNKGERKNKEDLKGFDEEDEKGGGSGTAS